MSLRAWAREAGTTAQTLLRAIAGDDKIAVGTVQRLLQVAGWKGVAVPEPTQVTIIGLNQVDPLPVLSQLPVAAPKGKRRR